MSQRSVGDPYPTQANGSPAWAAMDLEDLETWYRTQAMNELIGAGDVDVDPETEHPPYRWMNSRYPGFVRRLYRGFALSPGEFYADVVGISEDNSYDWGIQDDRSRALLSQYIDELRKDRGHPATMWQAVRSRLSRYARAYEDGTNQSIVAGLRDESRRPDEIQAAFETFSALVEDLGTPGSRRKYLSDVRGWYRWLVNIGEANYSPIVRFETRLNLDQPEYDNPSLSRDDVRVLVDAADTNREQLVVVALAGWGLRPSEVVQLRAGQMVLDPNPETQGTKADVEAHPYIEFGEGERKNGPGTVSMLAGVGLVDSWLDDVATADDWQGYVFESDDGHDPHISEDTLRGWFASVAERAGVTVDGKTATPKHARRFWYTLYGEVAADIATRYEHVAEEQGAESAAVVIENYLDEGRRRQETRQAMDKRLGDLFAGIQPDE